MNKFTIGLGIFLVAAITLFTLVQIPDWAAALVLPNDYTDQKDLGNSLPDPNRPYYNAGGQEFTASGLPITPDVPGFQGK